MSPVRRLAHAIWCVKGHETTMLRHYIFDIDLCGNFFFCIKPFSPIHCKLLSFEIPVSQVHQLSLGNQTRLVLRVWAIGFDFLCQKNISSTSPSPVQPVHFHPFIPSSAASYRKANQIVCWYNFLSKLQAEGCWNFFFLAKASHWKRVHISLNPQILLVTVSYKSLGHLGRSISRSKDASKLKQTSASKKVQNSLNVTCRNQWIPMVETWDWLIKPSFSRPLPCCEGSCSEETSQKFDVSIT